MIKEVIVVEGQQDIMALRKAVDAECIATGGFSLKKYTLDKIAQAYEKRGIIILTDPDSAGERIRKVLSKKFPLAKHAFISLREASAHNDIGVEQAKPEAIKAALDKVRYMEWQPKTEFTGRDIILYGLTGVPDAVARRAAIGEVLGIGYANAKTFLYRLNHYGVTRGEFAKAVKVWEENR
jgi:ribonuclease M5